MRRLDHLEAEMNDTSINYKRGFTDLRPTQITSRLICSSYESNGRKLHEQRKNMSDCKIQRGLGLSATKMSVT